MATGTTSERVYDAIRERLTDRTLRPGDKIDPVELARTFGSSVTPVRDALHILIGQGLAGTGIGEGFYVPHIDEPGLRDLYDWNIDLLLATLRRQSKIQEEPDPLPRQPSDLPRRTAELFATIARRSGSREHSLAMRWANARLASVRLVEQGVLEGAVQEIDALSDAVALHDTAAIKRIVTTYHVRRKRAAGNIIYALYRRGENVPAI